MWRAFSVKHLNLLSPWASSTAVAEGEIYARFCTSKLGLKINASSTCSAKFLASEGRIFRAQSRMRHPTEGDGSKGRMLGPFGNSGCCSWPRRRRKSSVGCGERRAAAERPLPCSEQKSRGTELERKTLKVAFETGTGMQSSVSCIPQHHLTLLSIAGPCFGLAFPAGTGSSCEELGFASSEQTKVLCWGCFGSSGGARLELGAAASLGVMHPCAQHSPEPSWGRTQWRAAEKPQPTQRHTFNALPPRFPQSS